MNRMYPGDISAKRRLTAILRRLRELQRITQPEPYELEMIDNLKRDEHKLLEQIESTKRE